MEQYHKNIKKIYWGLLIHDYNIIKNGKEIPRYDREMTLSDCCCAEEGLVLYDTKEQAKDSWRYRKGDCYLVKYKTELVEYKPEIKDLVK